MNSLPVVLVSGRIAVGKTTFTQALADALKVNRLGFGDEVRARATAAGRDHSRETLQEIGEALVRDQPEEFCRAVLARGQYAAGEGLVIEGIRHLEIIGVLRRLVAPQRLVHVHIAGSEEMRRARLASRDRVGESASPAVDSHSTERQLLELLPAAADFMVDGDESLEAIVAQTRDWLIGSD